MIIPNMIAEFKISKIEVKDTIFQEISNEVYHIIF